jgi:UDP-GlcNAc:undecaprenyl-phosphate GlcNAc-1-phosphate transferase
MIVPSIAFLCATVFAAVLTPLVRAMAVQRGAFDHALSARKIHGRPVPRLGGIAIVGAFYLTLLGLPASGFPAELVSSDLAKAAGLLMGGLLIGILGVYDDLRGCRASQKFVVQFAVAGMMYALGFRIGAVSVPFGSSLDLGPLSFPVTLLWIVGVTNAFNLIDGLDGLAGGVALVAVATNLVIALARGEAVMVLLYAALAGSIVGFLFYNFNPASIFMGDTGSMFLGFVLGTIAIEFSQKASAAVAILIPILALGLPLFDTGLAVVRRAAGGRPIFQADREHIHHRLLEMGLTHKQAVLALYMLSILLGTMAVALSYASSAQSMAILGGLGGLLYLLLSRLGYLGGASEPPAAELASGIDVKSGDMREVWAAVRALAEFVAASSVTLRLVQRGAGGETVERSYSSGAASPAGEALYMRFRVPADGRELAVLELGWRHAGFELQAEHHAAIAELCDQLARTLEGRGAPPLARVLPLPERLRVGGRRPD